MDHIHDVVRQQFSQYATYYAQSKVHAEGETLGVIVDFAQPRGTEKVLDIATGTGFTAFAMAPRVSQVIATDLTPAMLDQAKALAQARGLRNIDFQVAAAESLPFEAESFDLVTCRIAPHHFRDVLQFLAEVYRVLRPAGLFCMVDSVCAESERLIQWQNRVEKMRDRSHVWGYPPSEWREMVLQAGLNLEEDTHTSSTEIPFSWWAERAGNPSELVKQIREAFEELSPEKGKIFAIRKEEEELYFAWPMYGVKASKPDRQKTD